MKAWEIVGWTADADVWCPGCFIDAKYDPHGNDHEGNPVHPIFASDEGAMDEVCGSCHEKLEDA